LNLLRGEMRSMPEFSSRVNHFERAIQAALSSPDPQTEWVQIFSSRANLVDFRRLATRAHPDRFVRE
jgi:hypothetical protein